MKEADSLAYVRNTYGVPARRGMRARHGRREGRITRGDNYVWVRFEDAKFSVPCHPTWRLEYLGKDGVVIWARRAG